MFLQNGPRSLSEIERWVQALLHHLRLETDQVIIDCNSYYDFGLNACAYEMSNDTIYLLNEINQWIAIGAGAY